MFNSKFDMDYKNTWVLCIFNKFWINIQHEFSIIYCNTVDLRVGLKGLADTKQSQQKAVANWTVKTNERESSLVIEDD